MNLEGSRVINADRHTVWEALNDPQVLKAALPGCEELSASEEGGYEAKVVQKVGPVKATFRGVVTLSDVVAYESYTISGEGKGGAAGFARGAARVRLSDAEGGTELGYAVEARVGGKLAQLGSRVIDGFAKKMADQFFERFADAIDGPGELPAAGEVSAAAGDGDAGAAPGRKGWVGRILG